MTRVVEHLWPRCWWALAAAILLVMQQSALGQGEIYQLIVQPEGADPMKVAIPAYENCQLLVLGWTWSCIKTDDLLSQQPWVFAITGTDNSALAKLELVQRPSKLPHKAEGRTLVYPDPLMKMDRRLFSKTVTITHKRNCVRYVIRLGRMAGIVRHQEKWFDVQLDSFLGEYTPRRFRQDRKLQGVDYTIDLPTAVTLDTPILYQLSMEAHASVDCAMAPTDKGLAFFAEPDGWTIRKFTNQPPPDAVAVIVPGPQVVFGRQSALNSRPTFRSQLAKTKYIVKLTGKLPLRIQQPHAEEEVSKHYRGQYTNLEPTGWI